MRTTIIIVIAGALAGCKLTNEPNRGPEYRGAVSGSFIETVVMATHQGVKTCKYNVGVTGVAWIGLESEGRFEGDGGVNLRYGPVSYREGEILFCTQSSADAGSTGGDWTTINVRGTATNITFSMGRRETQAAGNPNAWTDSTHISFTGAMSGRDIAGNLTFTRIGSGNSGGFQTSTNAAGTISVRLIRCDDNGSCGS